ncbi:SDR family oxidoreductase [Pseudomonas vancouverensis]|uniref:SDR family oxidoreductase n=1 Tax=Pseudomonas vancouverensis TaxID=95300 RepID=UPI003CFCF46B
MNSTKKVIATIGCSGHIAKIFVEGLLQQNLHVRLLARDAQKAKAQYPTAEVIEGSMMNPDDVYTALKGADAAFLVTPMGVRNDKSSEVAAAKPVIAAAQRVNLKHLIYISVLQADKPSELSLIDAKHDIEVLLSQSGVPWTAIRPGSFMEDVFDIRMDQFAKGKFLFPVIKDRRFTYTSQKDISRFVAQNIEQPLGGGFNFVAPRTYSIYEVEGLLKSFSGREVTASGRSFFYYTMKFLQPLLHWKGHKLSTIIPLVDYFNKYGYVDSGFNVEQLAPDFKMTTLEEHLGALF